MNTIKVKDICQFAMFEQDGVKLREEIQGLLKKGEKIQLDFSDVEFFTTMFFNASVGWIVLNLGPEILNENVTAIHLNTLGKTTWEHSYNNALKLRENNDYREAVMQYDSDEDK